MLLRLSVTLNVEHEGFDVNEDRSR